MPDTFPCPHCGGDVPEGALACPHCGSDAETGWSEDTMYDDIGLPPEDDEDFDDPMNMPTKQKVYLTTAALLLVVILFLVMLGAW